MICASATANLAKRAPCGGLINRSFPTADSTAGYANTRLSKAAVFGLVGAERSLELYEAGFDAMWELDLFGRIRRSLQASTAEMQAAEANIHDVQVTILMKWRELV